jgi:hypothetical protein
MVHPGLDAYASHEYKSDQTTERATYDTRQIAAILGRGLEATRQMIKEGVLPNVGSARRL